MSDGFCRHSVRTFNEDTYRYDVHYETRDIFKCDEHKKDVGYSDYLAKDKAKKHSTEHLAPLTARPKYSKGDNPRWRFKNETVKAKGRSPIKTVDAKGHEHMYKLTKKGFKEL
jgi:hypothetical protein